MRQSLAVEAKKFIVGSAWSKSRWKFDPSESFTYSGTLRIDRTVWWRCQHAHPTTAEARECARRKRSRRPPTSIHPSRQR